jgi:hypothetical protein
MAELSKLTMWERIVKQQMERGLDCETARRCADQRCGLTKERKAAQRATAELIETRKNAEKLAQNDAYKAARLALREHQSEEMKVRIAEYERKISESGVCVIPKGPKPFGEFEDYDGD